MEAELQKRHDNAWETIKGLVLDYWKHGTDTRDQALALARAEGVELHRVNALFDEVEADQRSIGLGSAAGSIRREQKAKAEASGNFLGAQAHSSAKKILAEPQPEAEEAKPEQPAGPVGIRRLPRTKPEEKLNATSKPEEPTPKTTDEPQPSR